MSLVRNLKRFVFLFCGGFMLLAIIGWLSEAPTIEAATNLITNPGFEQNGSPPNGWYLDPEAAKKGTVTISKEPARRGQSLLVLAPNSKNGGDRPLGLGQSLDVKRFQGQRLVLSGWLGAEGKAVAVLGALLERRGGGMAGQLVLRKTNTGAKLERVSGTLQIPTEVENVILVVGVEGTADRAFFDDLAFGPEAASKDVMERSPTTGPIEAIVEIDARRVVRTIPRTLYGTNLEWIYDANLLWDAQQHRPVAQLVDLTRDLNVSLIRFPGGGFSDYYQWLQGIGPHDRRPEADHLPGGPRSKHNFGTDEALDFASQVNASMLITVNASTGTAAQAADWVKYVNGRANAGSKSTKVTYWEIGNELYMAGAHPGDRRGQAMPAQEYAKRFQEFAIAMRQVDPTIKLMAIGGENRGQYSFLADGQWNRKVVPAIADQVDLFAVHNAYAPIIIDKAPKENLRNIYAAMLAAPMRIRDSLRSISDELQRLAPQRDIKLAVTEWGPLFHPEPGSALVDHVKTLGSALYVGCVMKEFIEAPSMEVANFFTLNGVGFMGWIGTSDEHLANTPAGKWNYRPKAPYYALQLYTQRFASELVRSNVKVETYDSPQVGLVDAIPQVPYLAVVSSKSPDGKRLTIIAINRNFDRSVNARISVAGFSPSASAKQWRLEGTGIDANTGTRLARGIPWAKQIEDERNPRFASGGPEEVRVIESPLSIPGSTFTVELPRASMTCMELVAATEVNLSNAGASPPGAVK